MVQDRTAKHKSMLSCSHSRNKLDSISQFQTESGALFTAAETRQPAAGAEESSLDQRKYAPLKEELSR